MVTDALIEVASSRLIATCGEPEITLLKTAETPAVSTRVEVEVPVDPLAALLDTPGVIPPPVKAAVTATPAGLVTVIPN
jgi:ribosome biogenesis GTPase A